MKKAMVPLIILFAAALGASENYAYLYPSILKTGKNLIQQDLTKWSGKPLKDCQMLHGKGSPFSPDGQTLIIDSNGTSPNYWGSSTLVQRGHTYLVGGWVKNDNAKILFWSHSSYSDPKERVNDRIYFFSGGSRLLDGYLSDSVKQRLGGDPDEWHLCYRLVEIPKEGSPSPRLSLMIGTYFATGKITIAAPFVIDVTDDAANWKLTLDIRGTEPVHSASVLEQNVRDTVWQKNFTPPAETFNAEIPGTDFRRGLDKKTFEGYLLKVEYANGKTAAFSAPKEKTVKGL
jgi:hypothetical protein